MQCSSMSRIDLINATMSYIQEYKTTALFGCETDSFDSEGAVVRVAPWKHVTPELVEEILPQFRGEIQQKPPMCVFSI